MAVHVVRGCRPFSGSKHLLHCDGTRCKHELCCACGQRLVPTCPCGETAMRYLTQALFGLSSTRQSDCTSVPGSNRTRTSVGKQLLAGSMQGPGPDAAHIKRGGNVPNIQSASSPLLALPVEVLQQVLGMLSPQRVRKLLRTCRAMAQEVMRYKAGTLTLKVQLPGVDNLAAIRQLLQWAPPSSLKLRLSGPCWWANNDRGVLSSLFDIPSTVISASNSLHQQHMQQLPCLLEVQITDCTLPDLVPAGLTATCPNMHTLHLYYCTIHKGNNGSQARCCSDTGTSPCTSVQPAQHLHTLILRYVSLPELLPGNVWQTRCMQPEETYANQLKSTIPNVHCLKLLGGMELLPILGPQLCELHVFEATQLPTAVGPQMQKLQKLVLPDFQISSAVAIRQLLSLPSVTHLTINSAIQGMDHSSHAVMQSCKWQYLGCRLRHARMALSTLAKLPLHSLTHPVELGSSHAPVQLCLPGASGIPAMERLGQQLMRCGVQLGGRHVAWSPEDWNVTGADLAAPFRVIAQAVGHQARVAFNNMPLDQVMFAALAAVYGSSLKQLDLHGCIRNAVTQAAWHAALSGLSSLTKIEVFVDNQQSVQQLVRTFVAAMAQQPAGRCVEVVMHMGHILHLENVSRAAKAASGQDVEAVDVGHELGSWLAFRITTKHRP